MIVILADWPARIWFGSEQGLLSPGPQMSVSNLPPLATCMLWRALPVFVISKVVASPAGTEIVGLWVPWCSKKKSPIVMALAAPGAPPLG